LLSGPGSAYGGAASGPRSGYKLAAGQDKIATNHLGHFQLALGLHDALRATGDARVVVVSSVGHVNGEVVFDDVDFTRRPYDPWAAYSQSKTANILFAIEAAQRWAPDHIAVNALSPGRIAATGLSRHLTAPPAGESRPPVESVA
jgi:NAD(P)-dependent dehydrogenase (short-subunit alcohol dehydrogenase family)